MKLLRIAPVTKIQGTNRAAELPPLPVPEELPTVGEDGTNAFGYPLRTVDRVGFLTLLRNERYDDLDRYVHELQTRFEADFRQERVIGDALAALTYYRDHRQARLAQVEGALVHLEDEAVSEDDLPRRVVEIVYADVDPVLWGAAELSVRAQLAYLRGER